MTKRLFTRSGLSLERLRTFCEVVSAAGISKAAPGYPNRQSQFSRQLKELEEFFGAELLRRTHGRFELTSAGRELFEIVKSHFNALEDLADRCANENIEVTFGAGESLLHWLLLPCLAEFRRKHPTIALVLHNLRTDEITNRLCDAQLDLGLLRQDAVRPPLGSASLGSIEYRLIMPRDSRRSRGRMDIWASLAKQPVAILAESEVSAAFEGEATTKGIRLNVCLRASSYAQLTEAVSLLGCAAVLPTFASENTENDIVSIPALKAFTRLVALVWNPRFILLRPSVASAIETLTGSLRRKFSRE
jgi:DNA-binding transcriptional LysR family regulator